MNAFYQHHRDSISWHYRCFDRILLNGLIQPFQQPERVVGFFNSYRQVYPVSRDVLRAAAEQFQGWVKEHATTEKVRAAAASLVGVAILRLTPVFELTSRTPTTIVRTAV